MTTKPEPKKQSAIKTLLLFQPALDPPSVTINVGRGNPVVSSISPHEAGAFVMTEQGRSYIIPWANIRHAELE